MITDFEKTIKKIFIQKCWNKIKSFREEMKSKGISEYYSPIATFHLMT